MPAQCTETSECTLADVLSAIEDIEEMMEHNYVYVRPPPPPPLRWFVTACAVGGCYTHRPSRVGFRWGSRRVAEVTPG